MDMGIRPSAFLVEFPEQFQTNTATIYDVGISQVYNFMQESILKPNRYIFYDVRGK